MKSEQYIRLTKLTVCLEAGERNHSETLSSLCPAGTVGHRLAVGYSVDGWFLEDPAIGRPMVMLRFRRGDLFRLGLFTSSLVIHVSETEIRTENSIYGLELRSFVNDGRALAPTPRPCFPK